MLTALLALTLFVSAFLLFWCQPMVAKMVLPFLGGSASVWTTCVVFFQLTLLAGYVYAHVLARRARLAGQFFIHIALMVGVFGFMPLHFTDRPDPAAAEQPFVWLLIHLLVTVGIPFFTISTTAPLLQNWVAQTRTAPGKDPYFLYAASNAGSLLALMAYPLILEPRLGVSAQSRLWATGYALLVLMVAASATLVSRQPRRDAAVDETAQTVIAPTAQKRVYWLAAAFVPSALMLAVTTHISVNLASVPFLWVIPLAIYLLTFIMAFATTIRASTTRFYRLSRLAPIIFLMLLPMIPDAEPPGPALHWALLVGHLLVLFFGAYVCHTALAAHRPDTSHLTEFYFWIALGGALGGIFAAIIAPQIFSTVFEYPLLVATLPFFRKADAGQTTWNRKDWVYPAILGVAFVASRYVMGAMQVATTWKSWTAVTLDVLFFIAVFLCRKRPLRFGLAFATLLFGYIFTQAGSVEGAERVYVVRNFFGVKKVLFDVNANTRKLVHGDTLHGVESMDPFKAGKPIAYYHPDGPIGDVMQSTESVLNQKVGVLGLGTATMAAYAGANRHITFFDVDPQVETIARGYFTFLRRCQSNCNVVIGDGRLSIAQTPDGTFDLLMLDAFSSDSIPTHLVSREALQIYLSKLKPNGLLLFHVSNRYLNVARLVAAAVTDAKLVALYRSDREERVPGKSGADCVIAARSMGDFGKLAENGSWHHVKPEVEIKPWTDDYSNLLSILRWN